MLLTTTLVGYPLFSLLQMLWRLCSVTVGFSICGDIKYPSYMKIGFPAIDTVHSLLLQMVIITVRGIMG